MRRTSIREKTSEIRPHGPSAYLAAGGPCITGQGVKRAREEDPASPHLLDGRLVRTSPTMDARPLQTANTYSTANPTAHRASALPAAANRGETAGPHQARGLHAERPA